MTKNNKTLWILWGIWTLFGIAIIFALGGGNQSLRESLALVLGLAPLVGIQLALGSPRVLVSFRTWVQKSERTLLYLVLVFTLIFALPAILLGGFDPYFTAVFAFALFAAFGTLKQIKKDKKGLTWADAAIWLLIWIPFDLRWSSDLQHGAEGFGYSWWSVAVTVFGVVGWYAFREAPNFGYRLSPRWRDIGIALLALLFILILLVPFGLGINFISFSPPKELDIVSLAGHFVGLFLTVALPEELFFRGILLRGLEQMRLKKGMPLFASSLAFGLMHWNNVSGLSEQVSYIALATIAGIFYGWAYKRSGNNILAPVITHSLVDLIWKVFLA